MASGAFTEAAVDAAAYVAKISLVARVAGDDRLWRLAVR